MAVQIRPERMAVPIVEDPNWMRNERPWWQQSGTQDPEAPTFWYIAVFDRLDQHLAYNQPETSTKVRNLVQEWLSNSREAHRALLVMTENEVDQLAFTQMGAWAETIRTELQQQRLR